MRVLVTRPEPDASDTAVRLAAIGHEAAVHPLIEIVFSAPPPPIEPTAIVLSSRNGARAVARWPQAGAWRSLPVFAGGDATAAMATTLGFTDVRSAAGTARELAVLVAAQRRPGDGPVLYAAAADRTGTVESLLAQWGHDVRIVQAYRARRAKGLPPAVVRDLASGAIGAVLLYSRRTATIFATFLESLGASAIAPTTTIYAISQAAAGPLLGLGRTIRVPPHPDEDSLLALLPRAA